MVVHDEVAHAGVQGVLDVLVGLVVAVEVEPLCREAPGQGGVNFTGGDHVGSHALILQHRIEALEAQGLAGKEGVGPGGHVVGQGLDIGAAVGPDLVLVQHIQGCAELLGQVHGVQTADGQMALFVDSQILIQHRLISRLSLW